MIYAAFFVQARHADLRRGADEAGLARIARKATRPRPIRVIGAALWLIRALNRQKGLVSRMDSFHTMTVIGGRAESKRTTTSAGVGRGHAGTHEPHHTLRPALHAIDHAPPPTLARGAPSNPCCAGSPTS